MQGNPTKEDQNGDIQIPVIDIPELGSDEATGLALVEACAKYGFVFIKGRSLGYTADTLDRTFQLVSFCIQVH